MEIKSLEPRAFFHWFEKISRVPRESGREEKIVTFLEDFFARRRIPFETDSAGNILARLPAAPSYEGQPSVLLQAHMDMVCRRDEGVEFDFGNDPIGLIVEGNQLRAVGTTLGADNAVGMATMLAIADDPAMPHPALELLFTACEEQGMVGIRNFDFSKIKARRMINMDCGDSHVIAICSAGKIAGDVKKHYALSPVTGEETVLSLKISGGLGGHSSICANKGRCCTANAMGYLLLGAQEARLCALYGSGAIIKDCTAQIAVPAHKVQTVKKTLIDRFERLKAIYESTDPDITLTICEDMAGRGITAEQTQKLALLLSMLRTGQITADGNDPATVMSLSIISQAELKDGAFSLEFIIRSTCGSEQERVAEYYQLMAEALGFELQIRDRYPVWKENPESAFREKFQRVHKQLFGQEMELERVAGGIEVVFITQAVPDMDPVGIAPTARGAHTTGEHLYISEVQPFWDLIKAVLSNKE